MIGCSLRLDVDHRLRFQVDDVRLTSMPEHRDETFSLEFHRRLDQLRILVSGRVSGSKQLRTNDAGLVDQVGARMGIAILVMKAVSVDRFGPLI